MQIESYEHLGALYVGRAPGELATPTLMSSRELTTHAVIVGMTGSGKTGLGAVLLEELAIDGVPAIVVDPKGDLGNLLLTFPDLSPASFAGWVPSGEDPAVVAARHARGLSEWGQDGSRIARFERGVERALYTPGSTLARPLSLLPSLGAPRGTDEETLRDRALAVSSGLLTLVGLESDPVASPEHALLSSLLLGAWERGQGHDPVSLLRAIQSPPFSRLGAMDLESVVPARRREALAVRLNTALASPAFAGFLSGERLDVARLLHTSDGRPRLSVLSIAHLSDADRMFFLAVLLGETVAWMRAQGGTNSLRAVLYVDEVFGFLPPVANPPSKLGFLTLLKQARAFGLGVVVATQNPADLDYKALSNAGTWFLGRLQTERDKQRVLDGLESAASTTGRGMDRATMDRLLSSLPPRMFVWHSVHSAAPRVFETRWTLSYLKGPLSRDEMRRLASTHDARGDGDVARPRAAWSEVRALASEDPKPSLASDRPVLPAGIRERFLVRADLPVPREYRAGLSCSVRVRYVQSKSGIDVETSLHLLAPLTDEGPRWLETWALEPRAVVLADEPIANIPFAPLPRVAARPKSYETWRREAAAHVARDRPLVLSTVPALGMVSRPFEPQDAFRARVLHALHEARDRALDDLERRWEPRIARAREKLEEKARRFEQASAERRSAALAASIEFGATVLGTLFGTRRRSVSSSVARAARSARSAQRRGEAKDAARAQLEAAERALHEVESQARASLDALRARYRPEAVVVEELRVFAKKTDVWTEAPELVWVGIP